MYYLNIKLLLQYEFTWHFPIIQEKLDFAMNDIIFDLLSIGRTSRTISPEVSLTWCTSYSPGQFSKLHVISLPLN